ncbi:hypothetical protein ACFQ6Q_00695 [Streptomyces sp. NPDC056437]|uniref:hypothetical protein n=1 Tax=Streptomyces sp. NPDC056437 TaxID=3345816 RepID=UPI0036C19D96
MGLFSRSEPKMHGYRPNDDEIKTAAASLNGGSQVAADDLVAHSQDYGRETAMRILGHCIEDPE